MKYVKIITFIFFTFFLSLRSQPECAIIDDMDGIGDWYVAMGNGALSATITVVSGTQGQALRVDYDLGNTTGAWVQIRRDFNPLLDVLSGDHLRFYHQGTAMNTLEVGLISASDDIYFATKWNQATHTPWWTYATWDYQDFRSGVQPFPDFSEVKSIFISVSFDDNDEGAQGFFIIDELQYLDVASRSVPVQFDSVNIDSNIVQNAANWIASQQQGFGLVKSWQEESGTNAWLYDQALALMVFSETDLARAAQLVAVLNSLQNVDGSWYAGYRLNAFDGLEPIVQSKPVGANAWLIHALMRYYFVTQSQTAYNNAQSGAAWLATLQRQDGSLPALPGEETAPTEPNLSAWWAFHSAGFNSEADELRDFLLNQVWDNVTNRFNSSDDTYSIFLDNQTWGAAFLRVQNLESDAREALSYVEEVLAVSADNGAISGFDGAGPFSVWYEGTLQYINVHGEQSQSYLNDILTQLSQEGSLSVSFVDFSAYVVWHSSWHGIAPTSWLYFASSEAPFYFPPAMISDLAIDDIQIYRVILTWTATGDDGLEGTAASYDLRYSTSNITEQNFSQATQVQNITSPLASGQSESFIVQGLNQNTTYFFAIQVCDEGGNCSPISNIVTTATLSDTDLDGLSDNDEAIYGTDPNVSDTDGDGMGDLEEIIAGTDPNDDQSFSDSLYIEDFDQGVALGDLGNSWSASGQTNNVSWDVSSSALVSTVTGIDYGYSYAAPFGKDVSGLMTLAISYDVVFEKGAGWGGLWYRGVYLDMNRYRVGWRDNSYTYVSSPIESGTKHHVLVVIKRDVPYYRSDVYVDGRAVLTDELIEVSAWGNDTVGFVSPYYSGNMNVDNFTVWPMPVPTPLSEGFDEEGLAVWIYTGNTNIDWSLDVGGLKSGVTQSGTGYSYAKHALLDVAGKDMLVKFNLGYYGGAGWGGFLYRDVYLDLNPTRIGWRDGSYTDQTGLSANRQHEAILIIRQNPNPSLTFSTLYVDGVLVPTGQIEASSFMSDTVGFVSNYYGGEVVFDDFYVQVVNEGDNLAPVFVGLEDRSVLGGESISYQISALDAEGSPFTYSSFDIGGLPGANLTNEGLLTWSPTLNDAGKYSLTVEVTDGAKTTTKVIQISVNTVGVEANIYNEDFEGVLDPGDNWAEKNLSDTETDLSDSVGWSLVSGELDATVTGSSGYSYYAPDEDYSGYSDLAIEYEVEYKDGATWGGVWVRGVYFDINLNRFGIRDDNDTYITSDLSSDTKHHVIIFVRDSGGSYESDVYVDGKAKLIDEPLEVSSFTNTIGFVSPYFGGTLTIEEVDIYDRTVVATDVYYFDGFEGIQSWIQNGATNTSWSIMNESLVVQKTSSGGYSYLWPHKLNVKGKDINIEFDVTYKDGASWGGLYYKGVYLDLNPTRVGWRDSSYYFIASPMVEDKTYHVKVEINYEINDDKYRANVYIDNVLYLQPNEVIDGVSTKHDSVGFVSNYYGGVITIDNFQVNE